MTKDVLLSITGMQFEPDAEGGEITTVNRAQYYKKNDSHYILYDEVTEGFSELTHNRIKIKEHEVILTRKGLLNVQMDFEEQKKNLSNYHTPYGDLVIGIDTSKVSIKEDETEILVTVEYALEMNYEHLSDSTIQIKIRAVQPET
ncbi:MAG: DUF1934 domain-containing protein [Lachnospiraceae bacterium]|nr:DUF1934 domain-containing protein [Lachnospiraceae bacterium]